MSFDVTWNGTAIHTRDTKEEADALKKELQSRREKDVDQKLPEHMKNDRAGHVGVFDVVPTPDRDPDDAGDRS